jgi:hypothetical protein
VGWIEQCLLCIDITWVESSYVSLSVLHWEVQVLDEIGLRESFIRHIVYVSTMVNRWNWTKRIPVLTYAG